MLSITHQVDVRRRLEFGDSSVRFVPAIDGQDGAALKSEVSARAGQASPRRDAQIDTFILTSGVPRDKLVLLGGPIPDGNQQPVDPGAGHLDHLQTQAFPNGRIPNTRDTAQH
jgi:hypothetical protein